MRAKQHWVILEWIDGMPTEVRRARRWTEAAPVVRALSEQTGHRHTIDDADVWDRQRADSTPAN